MQYTISFNQPQEAKESINYSDAILLKYLAELETKYEKDKETVRFLYGRKRGIWRRETQADVKRSEKLDILRSKIKNLKFKLSK